MKMLTENIKIVREKIHAKLSEIGRTPDEVTLIAVSKFQPVPAIINAFDLGITNFGENKAQELKKKTELIDKEITWHFIGHLQTNKVKTAVNCAEFIHSVDSLKLASEIEKRSKALGKKPNVLLEINTSGEETKYGLRQKDEIFSVAEFCKNSPNMELVGLMTMAPFTDDEEVIRLSFKRLRQLKEELNGVGFNLRHLSMGMTNDYLIALEEGATMLRIGTAIFGPRDYSLKWEA